MVEVLPQGRDDGDKKRKRKSIRKKRGSRRKKRGRSKWLTEEEEDVREGVRSNNCLSSLCVLFNERDEIFNLALSKPVGMRNKAAKLLEDSFTLLENFFILLCFSFISPSVPAECNKRQSKAKALHKRTNRVF